MAGSAPSDDDEDDDDDEELVVWPLTGDNGDHVKVWVGVWVGVGVGVTPPSNTDADGGGADAAEERCGVPVDVAPVAPADMAEAQPLPSPPL